MSDDLESLVLDLVEWVAREPRSYAEVFDTWRTSCPRLPVWEEACDRGLVARRSNTSGTAIAGSAVAAGVSAGTTRLAQTPGPSLPPGLTDADFILCRAPGQSRLAG